MTSDASLSETQPADVNAVLIDSSSERAVALGSIVVPLLKGVVYRNADQARWSALGRDVEAAREHLRVLGLDLVIDEAEGYAFVRSMPATDDGEPGAPGAEDRRPRLVARRPLTFSVSLMLALLRRRLAEDDAAGGDTRLVLSRSEIVDLVSVFLPTSSNEARVIDRVETDIGKVADLGFLHRIGGPSSRNLEPRYEVRRVLKAFVDAQWLHEFDERLAEYRATLEANGGRLPDDRRGGRRSKPSETDATETDAAETDLADDDSEAES
jgi:hypothetical protein